MKHNLPLAYRSNIVSPIMQYLAAGDSCSIVGIGSVGKSNLLRFLQREDVHQAQLGDKANDFLFIYIDINKILKRSMWGLFELMLHQLLVEMTSRGSDESTLTTLDDLHQRTTAPETQGLALRYLDRAIGIICRQLKLKVVFLIDEFDDLCRTMSPKGFAALRALRDEYKYKLMYVVTTRLELRRLREELSEIEPFEELVTPHTVWLGPYNAVDAAFALRRIAGRYEQALDEATVQKVLRATGGHPGLLREGYNVAREHGAGFFEVLAKTERVQDECQRLWLSLSVEEQKALLALMGEGSDVSDQTAVVERLQRKGLVGGPWAGDHEIFSTLFASYINRQQNKVVDQHIYVDHERRTVWVNGYKVSKLTRLEYELMAYLDQKRGQACSRDELALHLYPEDMTLEGKGVADNRLDSVVKRLRKRVEPDSKNPRYIMTIHGYGFRLEDRSEAD